VQLVVTDCAGAALLGATVGIAPADGMTQVVYTNAGVPITGGTETGTGDTFITGVMAGSVTVTVTQAGRTLIEETFDVAAESWNQLEGGPTRTGT
jgi:hypothetical protein